MSVPGYGAEASLYRSTGQYRAAMMAGVVQPGGVAVPVVASVMPIGSRPGCTLKTLMP